jgi:hypothetical protein
MWQMLCLESARSVHLDQRRPSSTAGTGTSSCGCCGLCGALDICLLPERVQAIQRDSGWDVDARLLMWAHGLHEGGSAGTNRPAVDLPRSHDVPGEDPRGTDRHQADSPETTAGINRPPAAVASSVVRASSSKPFSETCRLGADAPVAAASERPHWRWGVKRGHSAAAAFVGSRPSAGLSVGIAVAFAAGLLVGASWRRSR